MLGKLEIDISINLNKFFLIMINSVGVTIYFCLNFDIILKVAKNFAHIRNSKVI